MINSLLSFGAKSVKPKILEQTLTVRKETVNEIEKNCVNKTFNFSTWQSLIIAPRGSGKTHLIKVLYHRLKNNKIISNKSVIAYMSEDEVGIANFTDLMVSILRAFIRYSESGSDNLETQISEASLIKDSNRREIFVKDILLEFAGKRMIILLIENFDKILKSLGLQGQRSLRDFIHQYNNLSIIATSQNLIANLQDSKNPFYNFFNIFQLKKLDFDETVSFLEAIAKIECNKDLANEINKPEFEGKLRAIYELTEGNHRLLVTFYSFLKADFKSELSGIFIKVMNNLKPYYEQFINVLPAQQQKIVKHLSLNRGAISGKEISRACFIEPNVFSKQISLLYEKGMIDKNKSGKDVFYELKEPLMRICFEISENPNGISSLFVDFLSAYYDRKIIREQYLKYKYGARFQNEEFKSKYENEALMYQMALNESEQEKISFSHKIFEEIKNYTELEDILNANNSNAFNEIESAYENFKKGNELVKQGQLKEAIKKYNKVVKVNQKNEKVYFGLGTAYDSLGQFEEAIVNFQKGIEINPKNDLAYLAIGNIFLKLKQYNDSLDSLKKAVEINSNNYMAFLVLGSVFSTLKQYEEAIFNFQKVIIINPNIDIAFTGLAVAFEGLKQYEEAIKNYKKAVAIRPDGEVYYLLGNAFLNLEKYEEAIKSYQNAVKIKPEKDEVHYNMGVVFSILNQYEEAIESYHQSINFNPNNDNVYYGIGLAFAAKKKYAEAIQNFQKAINLNPDNYNAFNGLGVVFAYLEKYEEAINSHQKAIDLNPDDSRAYIGLGEIYLESNQIENAFDAIHKGLEINPDNMFANYSLLGAYIRINDQNKSKELLLAIINKVENDLLIYYLTEDVFYNLFMYGSDAFIKSYFGFLVELMIKEKKVGQLWKALPESLFNILINIDDYDNEGLNRIEIVLSELLDKYEESIIPLKMLHVGVAYIKKQEKNALFKLSKEERKLFKEAVLDKRELAN